MAHGGTAKSQRRTDHGKRAHGTDPNVRKYGNRERDARIQAAAEDTRKHQEELDRLIAEQAENPVVGEAAGAKYARDLAERQAALAAAQEVEVEVQAEPVTLDPTVKMRPCPDSKKCVVHPSHEWEQGGLQIKRWCLGYMKNESLIELPKSKPPKQRFSKRDLPREGDGKWEFAYTTARLMLKAGYNMKYVVEFTGVGLDELEDMPIDSEGYGIREKEGEDAEEDTDGATEES